MPSSVCVHVYVCICIYACVNTCVCVLCACMFACLCVFVCVFVCMRMCSMCILKTICNVLCSKFFVAVSDVKLWFTFTDCACCSTLYCHVSSFIIVVKLFVLSYLPVL